MKKKAYISPEMTIVMIGTSTLLAGSFTDPTSGVGFSNSDVIENSEDIGARSLDLWDDEY